MSSRTSRSRRAQKKQDAPEALLREQRHATSARSGGRRDLPPAPRDHRDHREAATDVEVLRAASSAPVAPVAPELKDIAAESPAATASGHAQREVGPHGALPQPEYLLVRRVRLRSALRYGLWVGVGSGVACFTALTLALDVLESRGVLTELAGGWETLTGEPASQSPFSRTSFQEISAKLSLLAGTGTTLTVMLLASLHNLISRLGGALELETSRRARAQRRRALRAK